MEAASALSPEPDVSEDLIGPAAILRGTARGLEVVVDGTATTMAIATAVLTRLEEAPAFFRGSDVRVRVDHGPLPSGCLARLDEIAGQFELRIVEVTAVKAARADRTGKADADAVPEPNLAAGSAPSPAFEDEAPTNSNAKVVPTPPVLPEIDQPYDAKPAGLKEVPEAAL